ncbi:DUF2147 domain-containing protein [Sphingomonas sp. DT-51]
MKAIKALLLLGVLGAHATDSTAAPVQAAATSALLGTWHAEDGSLKIEMFDAGGSYAGRMIYGRRVMEADDVTFKRDVHNPDPALRSRSLQHAVVKWHAGHRRWEGGHLYDGASGRTYSARIELKNGRMEMRGYMGSPVLGRTVVLDRVAG